MTISSIPAPESRREQARRLLLRRTLKLLVRPLFNGRTPVTVMRRGLALVSLATLQTRGVHRQDLTLGGVAAEAWMPSGRPSTATVLYLHGGAYLVGSPATHRAITRRLARLAQARVLALDYRLAPEHPYPAALEDAVAAWQALLDTGVDPARTVIAGDSCGGGLALALSQRLRDLGLPRPAAQMLLSPWADLTHPEQRRPVPAGEAMLTWPGLEQAARQYAGNRRQEPGASPLLGDFQDLPPTLTLVGRDELLLPQSERVDAALTRAGVPVRTLIYERMWHVFPAHAGLLQAADDALARMADFVREHACDRAS